MFAAIRLGLTEPEGHFCSFFAVSTQKYGLARQSLMFRHERNIRVLDHYSDVVLEGVSGMGSEFAKEDYRNFLQYLLHVAPDEYAPHKKKYDEECEIAEEGED